MHTAATFAVATRRRAVQHDPLRRIRDGRCAPEDVQREKARQLESWDRWVAEQVMRKFKRSAGAKRDPPLGAAAVLSGTPRYEPPRCYVGPPARRGGGAKWDPPLQGAAVLSGTGCEVDWR